jgi:hypothetical protein
VNLLADFSRVLDATKKAALDAVNASNPVNIMFGVVISAEPLEISVEQHLTLKAPQLVLSRSVTDYNLDAVVAHWTEYETEHIHPVIDTYTGGGTSKPTTHRHKYTQTKKFRVLNALKATEQVILVRIQGGQKFLVLDRLGGSSDVTNGEWIT